MRAKYYRASNIVGADAFEELPALFYATVMNRAPAVDAYRRLVTIRR